MTIIATVRIADSGLTGRKNRMNVLEKILEEIEKEQNSYEADHAWNYSKGLEYAKEIIRSHMSEIENDNWILCSERLPEDGTYLCTLDGELVEDLRNFYEGMYGKQEEHVQPELPPMKNNDQRKEWLRNYRDWGLWYEDEHIGAKYYRYEFENGAVLIAEEYECSNEFVKNYTSSYLHLVGGPESAKGVNGVGKWQTHEKYNRYPNSETELVEFLKEIQK